MSLTQQPGRCHDETKLSLNNWSQEASTFLMNRTFFINAGPSQDPFHWKKIQILIAAWRSTHRMERNTEHSYQKETIIATFSHKQKAGKVRITRAVITLILQSFQKILWEIAFKKIKWRKTQKGKLAPHVWRQKSRAHWQGVRIAWVKEDWMTYVKIVSECVEEWLCPDSPWVGFRNEYPHSALFHL